jgi:ribosomal RNA-processing protein 12
LYASESELDDSDEDDEEVPAAAGRRKGGDFAARLRVDDDEPMDLLSGAAARVTSESAPPLHFAANALTNLPCRCKR